MRKTKKKIEFSSHTGNLALMRNCVRRFLEAFPFSERQRTLMVLGVDEACSNIIRHAYHLRNDQFISLSLEGKDDCVCLRLRDYGKQPQPESMEHRRIDLIRPGGLGLHLIRNELINFVLRQQIGNVACNSAEFVTRKPRFEMGLQGFCASAHQERASGNDRHEGGFGDDRSRLRN